MSGLMMAGVFLAILGLAFGFLHREEGQTVPGRPNEAADVPKGGEK